MHENAIQRLLRLAQRDQQTVEVRRQINECMREINADPELRKSFQNGLAFKPDELQSLTHSDMTRFMGEDLPPFTEEQKKRMLQNVSRALSEGKNDN